MTRFLALPLVALVLLLAACSSGPPKRVFPPQATVQELRIGDDGRWVAHLRIQNFSTVPMRFNRLEATFAVAGQEAARFVLDPGVTVGPGSAEVFDHAFEPAPAAAAAVRAALADRRGVRYALTGRLLSADPGTDDAIDYRSALDPVPGLDGVLR